MSLCCILTARTNWSLSCRSSSSCSSTYFRHFISIFLWRRENRGKAPPVTHSERFSHFQIAMSAAYSNETIVKQMCSGALSGSLTGVLVKRGQYLLSYLTLTSIGALDFAFHFNYIKAHITHLNYEQPSDARQIRSRLNRFQRTVQREIRNPDEEFEQEVRWLWADFRRHVDQHIYFGMGFTISFLISVLLVPKRLWIVVEAVGMREFQCSKTQFYFK